MGAVSALPCRRFLAHAQRCDGYRHACVCMNGDETALRNRSEQQPTVRNQEKSSALSPVSIVRMGSDGLP